MAGWFGHKQPEFGHKQYGVIYDLPFINPSLQAGVQTHDLPFINPSLQAGVQTHAYPGFSPDCTQQGTLHTSFIRLSEKMCINLWASALMNSSLHCTLETTHTMPVSVSRATAVKPEGLSYQTRATAVKPEGLSYQTTFYKKGEMRMSEKTETAKKCPGMGAIPGLAGVTFRVWAPHAESVYVNGTFNDWSKTSTPLDREENGCWSAQVSEAKVGDEYRYVINASVDWRQYPLSRIDPYARKVTNSKGNGIVYDPKAFNWGGDNFKMATGNELVIYEMHVGTFNVNENGRPGTFDSATEKFTYLKKLGINAIEVMPIMEFPGDFSWGYNPSHPFAVESIYGGPDAFKHFVKAAHEHGIAVIVDVVYNHFGPSDLDLWRFDGWSENEKGGIYFYNDRRSQTPWGETRPDYGRGEVRQYLRDNALMWFEEYHADGLRWDMIAYIKSIDGNTSNQANDIAEGWSLMQWINVEIQKLFPGKISIGESMRDNPWTTKDVGAGGAGFNAQWDAEFVHSVRQAIIVRDDTSRDLGAVCKAIEHRYDLDVFRRIIFTESHDEVANGRSRVPGCGKRDLTVTHITTERILPIIPPLMSRLITK